MEIPYPNYQDAYLYIYPKDSASIFPPYTYDKLECYDQEKPEKKILDQAIIDIKKSNCKDQSQILLNESDWADLYSVRNKLENIDEWDNYRNQIRKLRINPVENPVFPDKPQTIWKEL